MACRKTTTWFLWIGVLVLFAIHQDFWWWDDRTLVFGFLPIGLAYHALYSILSALLWALAVKYAWPSHIEAFANETKHPEAKLQTRDAQ